MQHSYDADSTDYSDYEDHDSYCSSTAISIQKRAAQMIRSMRDENAQLAYENTQLKRKIIEMTHENAQLQSSIGARSSARASARAGRANDHQNEQKIATLMVENKEYKKNANDARNHLRAMLDLMHEDNGENISNNLYIELCDTIRKTHNSLLTSNE